MLEIMMLVLGVPATLLTMLMALSRYEASVTPGPATDESGDAGVLVTADRGGEGLEDH